MSQKFGAAWQAVPDRTQGDWGIEGFVRPDGLMLQSYATEGRTPAERSSHQKGKLTSDTQKLLKNSLELAALLDGTQAQNYVFLVPFCDDKAVVAHAQGIAKEV